MDALKKKLKKIPELIPASLPLLIGGILTPLLIYTANQKDFGWNAFVLIPFLVLTFFLLVVLTVLLLFSDEKRNRVISLLFVSGVYFLVSDALFPVHSAVQPGASPADLSLLSRSDQVFDFCLLIVSVIVGSTVRWSKIQSPAKWFTISLLIIQLGQAAVTLQVHPSTLQYGAWPSGDTLTSDQESLPVAEVKESISAKPNVYHIVFDGYTSLAFLGSLAEQGFSNHSFDGFTFFEKNRSNFLNTNCSTASFLSGTFPEKNQSVSKWLREPLSRGIHKSFHTEGYHLSQYTVSGAYTPWSFVKEVEVLGSMEGQKSFSAMVLRVADLSLARFSPTFLRHMVVSQKSAYQGIVTEWAKGTQFSVLPPDHILSYHSVDQIEGMLKDERRRPARGQYYYVHTMLPHPPMSRGRACESSLTPEYLARLKRSPTPHNITLRNSLERGATYAPEGYLESLHCATLQMMKVIQALKTSGHYRDSIIIFQSDHGYQYRITSPMFSGSPSIQNWDVFRSIEERNVRKLSADKIDFMTRALLLIKPAGESIVPMKISSKPTQLVDVPNTLFHLAGIAERASEGAPVFKPHAISMQREQLLYVGVWQADDDGRVSAFGSNASDGYLNRYGYSRGGGWRVHPDLFVTK